MCRSLRNFISAGLLLVLPTAVCGLDLQKEIRPLAQPLIDDQLAVGLVIGVLRDGQTQVLGFGEVEKGSKKTPDAKTIYEIGSVNKVFTGILLAKFVDAGTMKLDDPVTKHLPASVKLMSVDDQPITLKHLVTHTSGLPRLPDNIKPADIKNPYSDYSLEQLYAFLNGHQLRRAPGEYEYSNVGMGLLGHVFEVQTGKTYAELIQQHIAGPLRMHDTTLTLNEGQMRRLALPYDAALTGSSNWELPTFAGAGAIRSTCSDLLLFSEACCGTAREPSPAVMQLAMQKLHDFENGGAAAMGWHIARDGKSRWHNGMTGGYASWISVVPEKKVGVVVLANTAAEKVTELGEMVTRVALGEKVEPPARTKIVEVAPEILQFYAGYYAIVPTFGLTVTVEDGRLMVQATGQQKFPVYAQSPTRFFYRVVDAQISFVAGADGKIDHLILHQNGLDLKGIRQNRPQDGRNFVSTETESLA